VTTGHKIGKVQRFIFLRIEGRTTRGRKERREDKIRKEGRRQLMM
jgi:hypothetical protein